MTIHQIHGRESESERESPTPAQIAALAVVLIIFFGIPVLAIAWVLAAVLGSSTFSAFVGATLIFAAGFVVGRST